MTIATHRVRPGALDVNRLRDAGGLFRFNTHHDVPKVRWYRDLTMMVFGAIIATGCLAWPVVGITK